MSDYIYSALIHHHLPHIITGFTSGIFSLLLAIRIYRFLTKSKPQPYPIDRNRQGVELDGGIYRSPLVTDPFSEEVYVKDVHTLYDGFQRGLRLSRKGKCLGTRGGKDGHYQWLTYDEVFTRVKDFGSGLMELGLKPSQEFLGIYSVNRVEWTLSEQACNAYSLVVVPLYDTLGPGAASFIIKQAELKTIVCDSIERARGLLTNVNQTPSVKQLIIMDGVTEDLVKEGHASGILVDSFLHIEGLGRIHPRAPVPPSPGDLATICYTSGTTGDPKGVMLTHGNIASNSDFITQFDYFGFRVSPDDVHISYLPMPHMFERCMQFMILTSGAQIGFFRGDIKTLSEDIAELKPTIFATVPRLLNRIYDKILLGSKDNRLKSFIFNMALNCKMSEVRRHIVRKDSIWDRIVFRKVQNILGGRIKCVVTGSAPIAPEVLNFWRCVFGCNLLEAYGLTEATSAVTLHIPGDCDTGYTGGPTPSNYVKLKDVPDMGYFASQRKGEVCVKGPTVFKGYYKSPEKTAETFDEDGWLLTGDIGQWLENGALKIIDRRKHILKLAQGEYISPERIESVYITSPFVAQIYVHGNSLKPYPVAIVIPDPDELLPWGKRQGMGGTFVQLCSKKEVKEAIHRDILEQGKAGKLLRYEQVQEIYLEAEAFTVDKGYLTPTLKNKRPVLANAYKDVIEQLYQKVGK